MEHGDEEAEEHTVEQIDHCADGGVLPVTVVAGHTGFRLVEALFQWIEGDERVVGFLDDTLHVWGGGFAVVLLDVAGQRLHHHALGVGREVAEFVLLLVRFGFGEQLVGVVLFKEQDAAVDLVFQLLLEAVIAQAALRFEAIVISRQSFFALIHHGGDRIGVSRQLSRSESVLGKVLLVILQSDIVFFLQTVLLDERIVQHVVAEEDDRADDGDDDAAQECLGKRKPFGITLLELLHALVQHHDEADNHGQIQYLAGCVIDFPGEHLEELNADQHDPRDDTPFQVDLPEVVVVLHNRLKA